MVDLSPAANAHSPPSPMSPTAKTVPTPTSPAAPRRMSSTGDARSTSRPDLARRRQSSHKLGEPTPTRGEATIRGVSFATIIYVHSADEQYYFHSLVRSLCVARGVITDLTESGTVPRAISHSCTDTKQQHDGDALEPTMGDHAQGWSDCLYLWEAPTYDVVRSCTYNATPGRVVMSSK